MGNGLIIWNNLCDSEETEVKVWENGDFNICFEKFVFSALPHLFLAVVSSYHFSRHQHLRKRGLITRYLTLHVRLVICLLIILSASFLFAIKFAYNRKFPPPVYVIWGLIYVFSWCMHSSYIWRLHRLDHLSLHGHWVAILSVFFVSAFHIVVLRTAILNRLNSSGLLLDFEEIFIYATTAFHLLYFLTFLKGQRKKFVSGLLTSPPSVEQISVLGIDQVSNVQTCPEDSSWFLSKLFFCWINSLMKNGCKGKINSVHDLFELPNDLQTSSVLNSFYLIERKFDSMLNITPLPSNNQSNILYQTLSPNSYQRLVPNNPSFITSETHHEDIGNQESQNVPSGRKRQKSLLWLLMEAFKWEYFPLGILKMFSDVCSFCNPILLNYLIIYISSPNDNTRKSSLEGYFCCAGLFMTTFLGSLACTQFEYRTSRVSLKFRSVIIDCIYRKTLSTSQVQMKSEFTSGEIVNLMSIDADRVVGFCPSFHQFWSLPIQICVVLYLLYLQVGLAFLSGVGFAVLLVPVNRWIAIKIGQLSKIMMSQKDARVKLINETLQGIRTVKFHAWEDVFTRNVEAIRSRELSSLMKRKYLDALCVFFWASTPVIISTLTFTTYILMGNSLTAAKVFTSISLFAILITPLNAFPWVVNGLMEAWVSLNRIQRFLDMDDIEYIKYYDFYIYYLGFLPTMSDELVLKMRDTSFTWYNDASNLYGTKPTSVAFDCKDDDNIECLQSGSENEDDDDDDDDKLLETNGHDEVTSTINRTKINLYKLNLEVKQGMLIGVVGSVGSGKSSLLMAILGEMKKVCGICPSTLSLGLPLDEGFGYFSQEPWIQRGTLKWNILFGKKFQAQKFSRVVTACALDSDIAMLPNGESTEIGENGVTLSGGQKARVALARTVYQDKQFYLLDDPYASVDVHVASRIHSGCIMNLLRHTTRIIVTHHVRFLKDADFIVVMEKGKIVRSGSPSHLDLKTFSQHGPPEEVDNGDKDDYDDELILTQNYDKKHTKPKYENYSNKPIRDADDDDELINLNGERDSEFCSSGRLHDGDEEEGRQVGVVKWKVYSTYLGAVGCCLTICIMLSLFFMQASRNVCDWWLSYWVTQTMNQSQFNQQFLRPNETLFSRVYVPLNEKMSIAELMNNIFRSSLVLFPHPQLVSLTTSHEDFNHNSSNKIDFDASFYLAIYGSLAGFNALATILRAVLFAYGGIEAARKMHCKLLDSMFKASIKFFDVTSLGRIINRFSSDVFCIDDSLPFILNIFLAQSFSLLGSIAICCYGLPFSIIAIFMLSIVYLYIQRYYRNTSRELKRISCVTLSPIYAHFTETLGGLPIIRAHRVTSRFERESLAHLDLNQRAQFASSAIIQWLNIRFQMIGVTLVTCVSLTSVLQKEFGTVSPGLVGLAISYVLSITSLLGGLVLSFTETEKMMIAVERVDDYISHVPHEDAFLNAPENIPELWPFVGVITFNDVTLRYGMDLPDVLKSVTFETCHGERVGVVGRTGSGKSSLFLALMRMVPIRRGKIYIDGVDIHTLPLREFRSRISMIPQDPFLFSGSIRENLDPSRKRSDQDIMKSLSRCNMLEVVEQAGGFDTKIKEKGQQFSAGQRQLLCLARTMLSESQVLCIDEATASVDMTTDKMLQTTIRKHFRGKTVITIAHRIETILDYDRVMVMCNGKLVEFDTPPKLLADPNSMFSSLLRAKDQISPPH